MKKINENENLRSCYFFQGLFGEKHEIAWVDFNRNDTEVSMLIFVVKKLSYIASQGDNTYWFGKLFRHILEPCVLQKYRADLNVSTCVISRKSTLIHISITF